jgi:RNA polymerase sigma-70 factor (ECF subfamily)
MAEIDQLYRAHGPSLLAYLRRAFGWCGSPPDMLQETFLQALRAPQRLADAESPRAWLFSIARHVGQTAARKYRPTESLEAVSQSATDGKIEQSDDLRALREAIAQLPATMREPLELRLQENFSYEEIAVMLEIPIGTVRSRLHNAMRRLREQMGAEPQKRKSDG